MNVLHLFAGAGGGVLADRLLGFRSVGYVEIEGYDQALLTQRIQDGCIDPAPIFGDIREFIRAGHAGEYRGVADVVAGGFPCQPFSVAGKRKGSADDRNLWPELAEVVRQVRPRYMFAENVPGLLAWNGGRYFGKIVGDLAEMGFDVRWCVLGASDVGAPHRRKRLWILADAARDLRTKQEAGRSKRERVGECGEPGNVADSQGQLIWPGLCEDEPTGERRGRSGDFRCSWWDTDPADLPDAESERRSRRELPRSDMEHDGQEPAYGSGEAGRGPTESRVGRVAHGVANRVDRLRAIGNGQVPLVAATAWRFLMARRRMEATAPLFAERALRGDTAEREKR